VTFNGVMTVTLRYCAECVSLWSQLRWIGWS